MNERLKLNNQWTSHHASIMHLMSTTYLSLIQLSNKWPVYFTPTDWAQRWKRISLMSTVQTTTQYHHLAYTHLNLLSLLPQTSENILLKVETLKLKWPNPDSSPKPSTQGKLVIIYTLPYPFVLYTWNHLVLKVLWEKWLKYTAVTIHSMFKIYKLVIFQVPDYIVR